MPAPAFAQSADETTFREFEQIVADFSPAEKIQAWEAFLQKYPKNGYVPKVREILSELKGEKPVVRPAPKPTPFTTDPDLSFLNDPTPTPTPVARPVSTPKPAPTATPRPKQEPNPFLDGGNSNQGTRTSSLGWGENASRSKPDEFARPPRGGNTRTPRPPRARGVGKASHTEIALIGAFAPDETYVRHMMGGMSATQRFGRIWGIQIEAYGATSQETPLLRSLRTLDLEPEVISKFNFMAGASVEGNLLSAIDAVTGQIPGRNDLFVRAGGGVVNTDLEICKQEGGQQCADPLFIEGVNFGYFSAGLGHRFYVTRWMTMKTEVRGRLVFELIDGEMTPRGNIQLNLGPTFVF